MTITFSAGYPDDRRLQPGFYLLLCKKHLDACNNIMKMSNIPFGTTEWSSLTATEHPGERGCAYWRTQHFADIRVRMVEYSAGYFADHWCKKGHILMCFSGTLHTELDDGRIFTLTAGMSYQVADNAEAHRSWTDHGARLFIVD